MKLVGAMALLACCATVQAGDQTGDETGMRISGSVLERYEFWDWFPPRTGTQTYNYSGSLLQVAVSQKSAHFDWMVDFAAPVLLHLPDRAFGPSPLGQYGLGANYFSANQGSTDTAGFFLKQGFLKLKSERSTVRLGRFEFAEGMEGKAADATLAALKSSRIQQHLIGIFGFSDVRRSFDGVDYERSAGSWSATAVTAIPTRGVFQTDGWGWVKTPFVYAAVTHDLASRHGNAEWRAFAICYNDDRPVIKTDNRPAIVRARDLGGIDIGTFGGHYIANVPARFGLLDVLAWGAAQTGKWGQLTQKSAAWAAEGGFQPSGLSRLKPWLRGGYFYSTGDGNPNDQTHGTFFTMLPTPRIYARFPFYNEINNRDLFAELMLRPHRSITVRSDAHGLWLANSHDLWYSGGGAFQPWTFGFAGRPSNGLTALARVYDTSADFQLNSAVALGLYFGYAQGGAVAQRIFQGDGPLNHSNAAFGFIEANYKF